MGFRSRQGKKEPVTLSAMYPHRIRLRGPWECEPINGPSARRVTMPAGWVESGLEGFRGLARFVRKFGYPGRVDETEHVWLVCDGCYGCREVRLNGQLLSDQPCSVFAFEVTAILTERNQLEVLIAGDNDKAGLWGEVAIEIRKAAFLAEPRLERINGIVELHCLVMGQSPQRLELYTLVDGRHVDYRLVVPCPAGTPCHIPLGAMPESAQIVRLELINISSIWYVLELPIPHWQSA